MKSCVRIGSLIVALGLAGLLAGCVSDGSKTSRRARDFEIVETSTKRQLTPKEMGQLQAMVGEYLKKEGVKEGGDYYVKVFLTPDKEGVPGDWVVVRYSQPTSYAATHFSLMSTYPDYGYSSYYPSYNFNYYPFGWMGGSAFALSYFDDPFYHYGYNSHYPRRTYTNYHGHNRDGDRDRDRDRDRNRDRDRDRPPGDSRPSGGLKPSFIPSGANRAPGFDHSSSSDPRFTGYDSTGRNDLRNRRRLDSPVSPPAVGTGTPYTPTYRPPEQTVSGPAVPSGRPSRTHERRERTNPESNRSDQGNNSSSSRQFRGQERSTPAPGNNLPVKPSHETRRRESSPAVQSSHYTSPAPRQESAQAPAYTPPPARTESESTSDNTRSRRGDGSHDAGRRARAE